MIFNQSKVILIYKAIGMHQKVDNLTKWAIRGNVTACIFTNAPNSARTRSCCYWARFCISNSWNLWIRTSARIWVTKVPIYLVHSFYEWVPYMWIHDGTIRYSIKTWSWWKVGWWHWGIRITHVIFLQNVSDPWQYAVCQVSKDSRICFNYWMPDILSKE